MWFSELSRYRLLSTLGHGESTIVYLAIDPHGRRVTLKTTLPTVPHYWRVRRQLWHEGRIGRRLNHPRIIRVFRYVVDRSHPCLIMEYFPGRSLKARLVNNEAIVHERMLDIIWDSAQALRYLHHQRIMHRDVKPENLLVGDDGRTKLTDFTLSITTGWLWRLLGRHRRRPAAGTRQYMAPETIQRHPIDYRTDIYSFGCTIYELLTGRPPFVADNPDDLIRRHLEDEPTPVRILNPEVMEELDTLVLEMLSKDRRTRPPSMDSILTRLAALPGFRALTTANDSPA